MHARYVGGLVENGACMCGFFQLCGFVGFFEMVVFCIFPFLLFSSCYSVGCMIY